jgi:hypothetical protein
MGKNWGASGVSSNNFGPAYFCSPWGHIIECQSGTVPSDGLVRETISLPGDGYTFNTSIKSKIPVEKFYSSIATGANSGTAKQDAYILQKTFINCRYLPLLVVDISSKLKNY